MKTKYIQLIISFFGLILISVNIYFEGHFTINIAMALLIFGMMLQAYLLNQQEIRTGKPLYFKRIIVNSRTISLFLMAIALSCIGFFFVSKRWSLFIISLLAVIYFGFLLVKQVRKKQNKSDCD